MSESKTVQIKTTWGKVFENVNMILLNEYPKIATVMGNEEELYQWDTYDEETEEYDEIYQWYILGRVTDVEWLKEYAPEIAEDIHWSDTFGYYILAVRHYGSGWDTVTTTLEVTDNESIAELYQKTFHDDLPKWVKETVLGEEVKEEQ